MIAPSSLKDMDYAFKGEPFVFIPIKAGMSLANMDYAFKGEPFVVNDFVLSRRRKYVVEKLRNT